MEKGKTLISFLRYSLCLYVCFHCLLTGPPIETPIYVVLYRCMVCSRDMWPMCVCMVVIWSALLRYLSDYKWSGETLLFTPGFDMQLQFIIHISHIEDAFW